MKSLLATACVLACVAVCVLAVDDKACCPMFVVMHVPVSLPGSGLRILF